MINPISKKYLEKIHTEYNSARIGNLSRYSVEWGKWSREMNLEIKEHIKNKHTEAEALKAVFTVWVCYSVILELNYKFASYRKKKERREAIAVIKDLTHFINTGNYLSPNFKKQYKPLNPNDYK